VARQYCGALGKIGNCQLGVSISAATPQASCPLNWRLFMPEEWDDDEQRRKACRVPEEVTHRPKWQLALEMIDELTAWGVQPRPVLADAAYGDVTNFRTGLEDRGLQYVLDVKAATSALPASATPEQPARSPGRGRPPLARYRGPFGNLAALALAEGPGARVEVTWREGTRGAMSSKFVALAVRPANVKLRNAQPGAELPIRWLLAEWPDDKATPTNFWLANLPADTTLEQLVCLAKLRWRIEQDYRELKDALGLDHFEGRSWNSWQHHVTLVSVAHGFLTTERLRSRPPLWAVA